MGKSSGFTLVSFILVLAVIGTLAAILLPSISEVGNDIKMDKMKADLRSVRNALEIYYVTYGTYLTVSSQAEWENPEINPLLQAHPRLIDEIPEDMYNPGHSYQYTIYDGNKNDKWPKPVYVVYTLGPDGKGSAFFKQNEQDTVEMRKGATAGYVTNARIVTLKP